MLAHHTAPPITVQFAQGTKHLLPTSTAKTNDPTLNKQRQEADRTKTYRGAVRQPHRPLLGRLPVEQGLHRLEGGGQGVGQGLGLAVLFFVGSFVRSEGGGVVGLSGLNEQEGCLCSLPACVISSIQTHASPYILVDTHKPHLASKFPWAKAWQSMRLRPSSTFSTVSC